MTLRRRLLGLAWVLLSLAPPHAGPPAWAADDAGAFVKDEVAAINSGNVERRRALLHPRVLPCVDGEASEIFEDIVARQARRPVPPGYRWKLTEVPAGQPLMFADRFDYPVKPTHVLQIDFDTGPTSSSAIMLQVAREGGRWREVMPCAKPETIVEARAVRQANAKQAEQVRALAAKTPAALRDTVVALFKDGRRVDAYRHYAKESGQDLATAKAVVELLAAQAGR